MSGVTEWRAEEIAALRIFNALAREQALAIAGWDRDSLLGSAVGPRPVPTPPHQLQAEARSRVSA